MSIRLGDIASARSGDKGSGANIGVIAESVVAYEVLLEWLTAQTVQDFFEPLGAVEVKRYEMPNLLALNFVLPKVLGGGASLSLRIDAQGKGLGQALLEMEFGGPEVALRKEQR
jgi:hypothetical protein